jgi:hypothetical protein
MFIFNKPDIILYIKKQALYVFRRKNGAADVLEFPKNIVFNMEVLDRERFGELAGSFFAEKKLKKNRALVLLSEEVVFRKIIAQEELGQDDEDNRKKFESFFDEVPFDPQKISEKVVIIQQGEYLAAVNKDLFLPITEALEKMGGKATYVVPAEVFGIKEGQESIDNDEFEKVISSEESLNSFNFLENFEQVETSVSQSGSEEIQNKKEGELTGVKKALVVLGIIILALAILGMLYYFGIFKIILKLWK